MDALKRGALADVVVRPVRTSEIAAIARLCHDTGTPLVPRGGGTGYSGGAVPVRGGVVVSLERLDRILEIDEGNLLAIVEPNVITGDLQDAVERVGLFYPPDPASLRMSTIGGNVAECAGGPRAFKYGVTRQYVLGLEAVLPTGEIVHTGGKVVKNAVGLRPHAAARRVRGDPGDSHEDRSCGSCRGRRRWPRCGPRFDGIPRAVDAVMRLIRARVVPSTMELIDGDSLEAVARAQGTRSLAAEGTAALLILEVDGLAEQVAAEADRVEAACLEAGASEVRARGKRGRAPGALARPPRDFPRPARHCAAQAQPRCRGPKARIPELFELIEDLKRRYRLPIPSFGHIGDGNIHVNIMLSPDDPDAVSRARAAEDDAVPGGGRPRGRHHAANTAWGSRRRRTSRWASMRRRLP